MNILKLYAPWRPKKEEFFHFIFILTYAVVHGEWVSKQPCRWRTPQLRVAEIQTVLNLLFYWVHNPSLLVRGLLVTFFWLTPILKWQDQVENNEMPIIFSMWFFDKVIGKTLRKLNLFLILDISGNYLSIWKVND